MTFFFGLREFYVSSSDYAEWASNAGLEIAISGLNTSSGHWFAAEIAQAVFSFCRLSAGSISS